MARSAAERCGGVRPSPPGPLSEASPASGIPLPAAPLAPHPPASRVAFRRLPSASPGGCGAALGSEHLRAAHGDPAAGTPRRAGAGSAAPRPCLARRQQRNLLRSGACTSGSVSLRSPGLSTPRCRSLWRSGEGLRGSWLGVRGAPLAQSTAFPQQVWRGSVGGVLFTVLSQWGPSFLPAFPQTQGLRMHARCTCGCQYCSRIEMLFVNGGSCLALEIRLSGAGRSLSCAYTRACLRAHPRERTA